MNSLTANFGAVLASERCSERQMVDTVNVHRMVTDESTEHDSEHGTLVRIDHQEFAHEASRLERVISRRKNVLHADLVGCSLAHPLQCGAAKSLRNPACLAVDILDVSEFVRDHESKFTAITVQDSHRQRIDRDDVIYRVCVCIKFWLFSHHHSERWHGVLLNASFCSAIYQAARNVLRHGAHLLHGLGDTRSCKEKQQKKFCHAFLSALLLVHGVLLLVARLCRSVGATQENQKQNHLARRIVGALASRLLVVKIGDRSSDASAWHRAGIVSPWAWSGNGTLVPRMVGESA